MIAARHRQTAATKIAAALMAAEGVGLGVFRLAGSFRCLAVFLLGGAFLGGASRRRLLGLGER